MTAKVFVRKWWNERNCFCIYNCRWSRKRLYLKIFNITKIKNYKRLFFFFINFRDINIVEKVKRKLETLIKKKFKTKAAYVSAALFKWILHNLYGLQFVRRKQLKHHFNLQSHCCFIFNRYFQFKFAEKFFFLINIYTYMYIRRREFSWYIY